MRQVTQTLVQGASDHPEYMGNCLQAAVASLFDLPIHVVPHFVLFGDKWLGALGMWLDVTDRGTVEYPSRVGVPNSGPCLIYGKSMRGIWHVCVGVNGELWWDPHPDRTGLESVHGALRFSALPTAQTDNT